MAGLKLYFDLLSQPSRSVYMFLKASKIPFTPKPVALRKGIRHCWLLYLVYGCHSLDSYITWPKFQTSRFHLWSDTLIKDQSTWHKWEHENYRMELRKCCAITWIENWLLYNPDLAIVYASYTENIGLLRNKHLELYLIWTLALGGCFGSSFCAGPVEYQKPQSNL